MNNLNNQARIIVLWALLILCMVLHFDYHVSGIFYGIDVRTRDAQGIVPVSMYYIRVVYHFLPLLYIALILFSNRKWVRVLNVVLAVLYALSHIVHLAEEAIKGKDPSQITLLSISALMAVLLVVASFKWNHEK